MTRILVADDDTALRKVLQVSLEAAGYEVEAVPNGESALRAQAVRPADVLITDIFMPDQDGLETVERFRERYSGVPIVAISGWKSGQKTDHLEVARVAGANAILRKPFEVNELLDQVRSLAPKK